MAYIGLKPTAGENNSFRILDTLSSFTATFNGSSASIVSVADDTISIPEHRFITGKESLIMMVVEQQSQVFQTVFITS